MYDDFNDSLAGDMSIPTVKKNTTQPGAPDFNTLDEPIKETIVRILDNVITSFDSYKHCVHFQLRDVKAVGSKFYHVLYPKEKSSLLKEWDLWGPLVLCTFMATILQGSESTDKSYDGGPEFAEVFVIVWIGAMIVTLNSKLLGGNM